MFTDLITKAYRKSKNIYDDILTQDSWLSKLYIKLFWRIDDNQIAKKVLNFIPNNFRGKLLDIPIGTAVFTFKKYNQLINADIICIDYSQEMLQKAHARFSNFNKNHIACLQREVANLNFLDNTFDIVLSMNGFHAFSNEKSF